MSKPWFRSLSFCAAILIALYFLLPFFLNSLARGLIRRDALAPADVVIALSGDARCERERYAAELYRQGLAAKSSSRKTAMNCSMDGGKFIGKSNGSRKAWLVFCWIRFMPNVGKFVTKPSGDLPLDDLNQM